MGVDGSYAVCLGWVGTACPRCDCGHECPGAAGTDSEEGVQTVLEEVVCI